MSVLWLNKKICGLIDENSSGNRETVMITLQPLMVSVY